MKFPTPNVHNKKQFLVSIEKRFRKEIRVNNLVKARDIIKVYNDGSYKYKVLRLLLNKIFGDLITIRVINKKHKGCFLPWNADDEIELFLEQLYNNKKLEKIGHSYYKKPLLHIIDEELELYAKFNGIKARKRKICDLDMIKKSIPNVKFSLLNSIEEISRLNRSK